MDTKQIPLKAIFLDINDKSIYDLSSTKLLPTNYTTNYPDSIRINLTGYKTGPGLQYSASLDKGNIELNTHIKIKLMFFNSSSPYNGFKFVETSYRSDETGEFFLFVQEVDNTFAFLRCSFDDKGKGCVE